MGATRTTSKVAGVPQVDELRPYFVKLRLQVAHKAVCAENDSHYDLDYQITVGLRVAGIHQSIEAYCDDVSLLTDRLSDILVAVRKFEALSGAILSRAK